MTVNNSKIIVNLRIIRFVDTGFIIVFYRPVIITLFAINITTVAVGIRIIRFQLDSSVKIIKRQLIFALLSQRVPLLKYGSASFGVKRIASL